MLSLYFDGTLKLQEVPPPAPTVGEALIQVHLAGVCRTDLAVLKGYHSFTGILGHEFVGTVVGPEKSPWRGQRVVGEITIACGHCPRCQAGLKGHCRHRRVLGLSGHPGVFARYAVLPEANLHAVPEALADEQAVFTEPVAAALAVLDLMPSPRPTAVLVVGDGKLGLLIAWVLALSGVAVHLVGHHPEHLNLARPYGVCTYLEPELPAEEYPLVVEASGTPGGLELALARVRPRGTVILKSTYAGRYPLDPALLVVPEVRLIGSRCGPFPAALHLLKQGWLDPSPLIAGIFPLSAGLAAIAVAQQPGVLKVLLDCRA